MSKRGFFERSLAGLEGMAGHGRLAEEIAEFPGWMQKVDARVKTPALLAWALAGAVPPRWEVPGLLWLLATGMGLSCGISWKWFLKLGWVPAGTLALCVGLPAVFLVPGPELFKVLGVSLSAPGARSAGLLFLRVQCSVTVALLLTLTTAWPELLRALRFWRMPALVTALLAMTQRYIYLLLDIAMEMFTARRARVLGEVSRTKARKVTTATAGVLLEKSFAMSEEAAMAMQARGFRGDFPALKQQRITGRDLVLGGVIILVAAAAVGWSYL